MNFNKENEQIDKTIEITQVFSPEELKAQRECNLKKTSGKKKCSGIFSCLRRLFMFRHKKATDETAAFFTEPQQNPETFLKSFLVENNFHLQEISERYQVNETPFASGGQGGIFEAADRSLGCRIAVKSLHKKLLDDPLAREAFCTEARLTAALDHPAIIPVHGLFSDSENGMHLAMKMIDGCTLRKYVDRIIQLYENNGILKYDEKKSLISRIEIFLRVCDAVGYAHAHGILHRDLKLENVMVGRYRETYVTDWGIAMTAEDADKLEKVCGTPGFIAPESVSQKHADCRSDIYSLGIILFELVTLTPAFSGRDVSQIIQNVKSGQYAPLRHRFGCRIDTDLAAIIRKAISLDPEERYQNVGALSEDIRRFFAKEEVSANPDNFISRFYRWGICHRRGMLISAMAALLIGTCSVAYSLYKEIHWNDLQHRRDTAVSSAYSNALQIVNRIEKSVSEVESMLERLQLNIRLSLLGGNKLSGQGKELFVPLSVYRKNFADGKKSDSDFNGVCVFNHLGKVLDEKDLHHFGNTADYMRGALLDFKLRRTVSSVKRTKGAAKRIYFVLTNGFFAAFPGSCDYPEQYDPRERRWYKDALTGNQKTVWSVPYQDVGKDDDLVTTCSLVLKDANGDFSGVGAVDFSLNRLAENILSPGGRKIPYLEEKLLINPQGDVIFRMKAENSRKKTDFSDNHLIPQMLRRKYGTLLINREGNEKLLVFSMIDQLNVLYVECLDMDTLIAEHRKF